MTIQFKQDKNDLLKHQLYVASKSERIKKKRRRSKIFFPLIYIVFAVMAFFEGNSSGVFLFFLVALLWFFLYPIWEKHHYIKHYKGYINENLSQRFEKTITLELNNDYIFSQLEGSESKVSTQELNEIIEIDTVIFLQLKDTQIFVLPKDKINNIEALIERLKQLADHLKINYTLEKNWKWE